VGSVGESVLRSAKQRGTVAVYVDHLWEPKKSKSIETSIFAAEIYHNLLLLLKSTSLQQYFNS